jgi:hypothetical protein
MLKTKGIRKTLTSLHKITRVTLRRAKIALSRPKDAGQGVQAGLPNLLLNFIIIKNSDSLHTSRL